MVLARTGSQTQTPKAFALDGVGPHWVANTNAKGVREFQPRVASTLGYSKRKHINAEGVRERLRR